MNRLAVLSIKHPTEDIQNSPGAPAHVFSKAIGLKHIVSNVAAKAQTARTVNDLAAIILTLDGHQDESAMRAGLMPHQVLLLREGAGLAIDHHATSLANNDWVFGVTEQAFIYLAPQLPRDPKTQVLASVRLPAGLARDVASLQEKTCSAQMDKMDYVGRTIAECGIPHALETVRFALCHSEPCIFHVNDETFSNFGPINNLLPMTGNDTPGLLFTELLSKPVSEWSVNQRILVFTLYLVRRAGGRCEEFSGAQLGLLSFEQWLNDRYADYSHRASVDPAATTFLDIADHIFALRQELKTSHFFYRLVNGLNFAKTEQLGRRTDICLSVRRIPRRMTEYLRDRFDVRSERQPSIDSYMRAIVERIASIATPTDVDAAIEDFLEALITTATDELRSDYGMSRAPRDFHAWAKALGNRSYIDICRWTPAEFLTAVYPGHSLMEDLGEDSDTLHKILYSVAGRMTYNSWHYAAGHCPIEAVPAERHFLYPPRMSDIVIVSHQHHAGHRVANVNLAIRSPAGLSIHGNKYYGLVDLRFVRGAGAPYTYKELVRAREFTAYARAFYQALVDLCVERDTPLPIRGYSKEWYANKYLPAEA